MDEELDVAAIREYTKVGDTCLLGVRFELYTVDTSGESWGERQLEITFLRFGFGFTIGHYYTVK